MNLSTQNQAVYDTVELDYFWERINFSICKTALDVGGHVGSWSHLCQQHAPHIQITSIEPHPDNYAELVSNCPTVTAIHGWVGYRDAVGLWVREGMGGSHFVTEHDTEPLDGELISLPQRVTLEDYTPIDILKLDCEGSEFDIITHCDDTTLARMRYIVGEYHLDFGALSTLVDRLAPYFELTVVPKPTNKHLGHFFGVAC